MKVLIVDDNADLALAVRSMLVGLGHSADTTRDAAAGVEMTATGTYDVVLVDYRMPEKDGVWFMENVVIPKSTKVLLMTAHVDKVVINRMFALGAVGYLIKPFDQDELARHLTFHSTPQ